MKQHHMMTRKQYAEMAEDKPFSPAVSAKPSDAFTLFRVEVLDDAHVSRVDPLLKSGDIVALVASITEPITVSIDGAPALTLTPADAGQKYGLPTLALFEAIVEAAGVEDTGETSKAWHGAWVDAARSVFRLQPTSPVAVWRGEAAAIVRMAETLGRSFGVEPESIGAATGEPFVRRRLLVPAMRDAKRMDEATSLKAEQEAREAAERVAAEAERRRPKTPRELGCSIVYIKPPVAQGLDVPPPDVLGALPVLHIDGAGGRYVGFQSIDALALPVIETESFRVVPDDEACPVFEPFSFQVAGMRDPMSTSRILPASFSVFTWTRALREHHATENTGPVTEFSDQGLATARALIEKNKRLLAQCGGAELWRRRHLVECCVRGCLVRPDAVAALLVEMTNACHKANHGPYEIGAAATEDGAFWKGFAGDRPIPRKMYRPAIPPLPPGAWQPEEIERLCVEGAQGGYVQPGALLEREAHAEPVAIKRTGKQRTAAHAAE
ncbi:MAG TPA: hypothetical protein VK841_22460 [Polyangiaceae bacterium]|jgi:hypothetical protein|nr:hypothetical protein [Polyangiaceae bacterium]